MSNWNPTGPSRRLVHELDSAVTPSIRYLAHISENEGFAIAAGIIGMAYEIQRWAKWDELANYIKEL